MYPLGLENKRQISASVFSGYTDESVETYQPKADNKEIFIDSVNVYAALSLFDIAVIRPNYPKSGN